MFVCMLGLNQVQEATDIQCPSCKGMRTSYTVISERRDIGKSDVRFDTCRSNCYYTLMAVLDCADLGIEGHIECHDIGDMQQLSTHLQAGAYLKTVRFDKSLLITDILVYTMWADPCTTARTIFCKLRAMLFSSMRCDICILVSAIRMIKHLSKN